MHSGQSSAHWLSGMSKLKSRGFPLTVAAGLFIMCALTAASSSYGSDDGCSSSSSIGLGGSDDVEMTVARNISAAIVAIVRQQFVTVRQKRVFNFHAQSSEPRRLAYFGRIIDVVLRDVDGGIGVRVGVDRYLLGDNWRHYAVLLVDSPESLRRLYTCFFAAHLHISGDYIILLHNFGRHYYDDLWAVAALNWEVGVINANVLVYALPNLILLFGSFPFNRFHCQGMAPTIQNRFVDTRWQQLDFYPDKLSNLHGCPMRCATWEDMPYFEVARGATDGRHFFGLEGKLLEYLAMTLNFSVTFQWMTDKEIERTVYDKGDVFHEFFACGTDFAIGAFHYNPANENDTHAPSSPYYLSKFFFVINSKSQPFSPFDKLLMPFAPEIWIMLELIFCGGIVFVLIAHCLNSGIRSFVVGARNDRPIYNMFVVSLGGTVSALPPGNFARFLLLLWLSGTMVLRCAYQAYVYHFIRTDLRLPPPSTIEEILSQNYTVYMTDMVYGTLEHFPRLQRVSQLLNGTELQNFDMLRRTDTKHAILTPMEYFGYFKRRNWYSASDFHVVPEKLFTQQLSIYMRKNSIMLPYFNQLILDFISVGLIAKWERVLLDATRSNDANANADDQQPKVLALFHLFGAICLLLIGSTLSVCVFIGELILQGPRSKASRKSARNRRRKHAERKLIAVRAYFV